jgi:putative ABC transport system permease protein
MLKSYWLMAWRSLLRNKASAIINIGGLMIGLTTGIVICLFLMEWTSLDRFQVNYKTIHLLELNEKIGSNIVTGNATPALLGPILKANMPSLKYVVRESGGNRSLLQAGDKIVFQQSIYAEPDFFHMMTFPAIIGDPVATLRDNSSVVLTQTAARSLFGTANPLGQTILLDRTHPLKVGAVVKDPPYGSNVQFDLVLPFSLFEADNPGIDSWESHSVLTWIQLQPGTGLKAVDRDLAGMLEKYSPVKTLGVFAWPMGKLELYANFVDGKPAGGKIYFVYSIAIIAGLVLLIACINFMNISTAMAEHRAREVGLRKVLGASRRVIMGQFLGEAMLFAMVALAGSTLLAYVVNPWFIAFSRIHLSNQFGNWQFWLVLVIIGLVTGFVAGSYPALYLSRFQPAKVLKRLITLGRGGLAFRKGLVTFQFVLSIFLIIAVIAIVREASYIHDRPVGYEQSGLLDVRAEGDLPANYERFKTQVGQLKGVRAITAANANMIAIWENFHDLNWPGKTPDRDFLIRGIRVQFDWIKTTGLKIVEGRDFDPSYGADSSACLLNQTAVTQMGLKEPVLGTRVGGKTVIGIVQDFVFNSPALAIKPLIVEHDKGNFDHFLVRLSNDEGNRRGQIEKIQTIVKTLNPAYPFSYTFTDDNYRQMFTNDDGIIQLMNIFGGMAILISCLGLYGLASFLVEKRSKEICVRRVLGAQTRNIWLSLSREFLKPVALGFVIAAPLAALALQKTLSFFQYHSGLSWWMFALAGVAVLVLALFTVTYHGIKAVHLNPAQALRMD